MGYNEIKEQINTCPSTYLAALLFVTAQRCIKERIFASKSALISAFNACVNKIQ